MRQTENPFSTAKASAQAADGVTQFHLQFQRVAPPAAWQLTELRHWRNRCVEAGIVGQDALRYDGIGFGNLSARHPHRSGAFIITGTQTGARADLGAHDFAVVTYVDIANNTVRAHGGTAPSSEAMTHAVLYQADAQTPVDRPHCFAYFITIHNDSDTAVTIKARKWVVRNTRGDITAVEGDGVVGQSPLIETGEKFTYNSYHLLDTNSAEAEGSYIGVDEQGRRILVRIPKFEMMVPKMSE